LIGVSLFRWNSKRGTGEEGVLFLSSGFNLTSVREPGTSKAGMEGSRFFREKTLVPS
jgi:hypothetical protein